MTVTAQVPLQVTSASRLARRVVFPGPGPRHSTTAAPGSSRPVPVGAVAVVGGAVDAPMDVPPASGAAGSGSGDLA